MRLAHWNRILRLPLSALVVLAVVATTAAAQQPVPMPEKLTLKEAIQLAVSHNARHRESFVSVQDAQSRRRSAGELRRSTVDGTITQTTSNSGPNTLDGMAAPRYDVDFPSGSTLSLSGTLPWIGGGSQNGQLGLAMAMPLTRGRGRSSETKTALERADLSYHSQELSHFLNQQSLVQQVVSTYFNAVRASELVKVQQSGVEIIQKQTDDTQKRLDAGLITEIDLTRAQLNLAQARESLTNQVQSQRNAVDDLVLLLGLPVGSLPDLTEPVTYTPAPVDLASALREAQANRPELQLFRVQRSQAEIDLRMAKDRKRPRADLVANLTNAGFGLLTGGGISRILTSVFGLRLNMPVSKTTLRENQAQAERQLDLINYLEDFQRQQIVDEVRGLVRAAETAKSNIDLLTANLEVAQKSKRIAQRLIEEGLADNRNYLDAQQSLTRTESNLLDAKVTYLLTMVSLRRALGQDLLKEFRVAPLQLPERPVFETASSPRKPESRRAVSARD